ncbi:uncharacterized protein LOC117303735 isoform X2 [Asterias rubens]|uniref:uncharacterized protein LOC117303735 isoform X2 n=1 Tax=Asterias rubens TaxID=7604 RepID=UPI001454F5F0|nr:uncharacterized protein LOC117303735 isoform X2 [Asterias rubens]
MVCDCCKNPYCEFLWRHYTPVVRIWGMGTAAAFWAVGITALQTSDFFGIYFIVVASIITLLEVIFFFEPCFEKCCSCCGKTWTIVSWLDNWKRSAIYIALSVICYLDSKNIWAIVAAVVLDTLAILYMLRTYQQQAIRHAGDLSPEEGAPSASGYSRFDEKKAKKETDSLVASSVEKRERKEESTNPFDDDADPEGDAGISRYPQY